MTAVRFDSTKISHALSKETRAHFSFLPLFLRILWIALKARSQGRFCAWWKSSPPLYYRLWKSKAPKGARWKLFFFFLKNPPHPDFIIRTPQTFLFLVKSGLWQVLKTAFKSETRFHVWKVEIESRSFCTRSFYALKLT